MENDLYKKLANHLDNLPGGFPSTESGVELRILRKLFTPEEAALAVHLSLIPEESKVLAHRAKMGVEETSLLLENMAKKGLILNFVQKNQPTTYMAAQFIIGIWEYHVKSLDEELIRDMEEYDPVLLKEAWKVPQMRTIPVNRSIKSDLEVMTYEMAEQLVDQHQQFAVAPCICREKQALLGKGCDYPRESCLIFGFAADYYQRNNFGRAISKEEVLEILKKADEAGLVLQPGNAKETVFICCCCGCCCGVLRDLKRYPKPASRVVSAFQAELNSDTCTGCGICVKRCQMDALSLEDGHAVLDLDYCIGCGLCVPTCKSDSLKMVRKSPTGETKMPSNIKDNLLRLGKERGKLSLPKLIQIQVKSKLDRILASK
jgi:electron transport complex protein RnfB